MYLQYVNTLTAALDNTKIVPGQPISCTTLAVRGGHGTTWSGDGRYSSEKTLPYLNHYIYKTVQILTVPSQYTFSASICNYE
jgi:hypothetical protein